MVWQPLISSLGMRGKGRIKVLRLHNFLSCFHRVHCKQKHQIKFPQLFDCNINNNPNLRTHWRAPSLGKLCHQKRIIFFHFFFCFSESWRIQAEKKSFLPSSKTTAKVQLEKKIRNWKEEKWIEEESIFVGIVDAKRKVVKRRHIELMSSFLIQAWNP